MNPNLKTEDVIMCCLVRVTAHFREALINEYGAMA
jgi:hypothetical protein